MLKKYNIILLVPIFLLLAGCSNDFAQINSLEDLENRNVGVYTGSEYDTILKDNIMDATPVYYNSYSDQISALKSGKIDAFLTDEPLANEIIKNTTTLKILDSKLTEDSYAFAINPKNKNLKQEIDKILSEMKIDGTIERLANKWFGNDDSVKEIEEYDFNKFSKSIKFATVSSSAPFAYMKNNKIVGYDIDIINYIGYQLGYKVEIIEMSFEGIIPALISGKVDLAGCSIIVTEERKKSVLFSLPNYTGGVVVVVRES